MSSQKYRLTRLADDDIEEILAYTDRQFGPRQLEIYRDIIHEACQMVGEEPMRPSSSARDELGQRVRSFHLEIAATRKGAASHILYYIPGELEDGERGAVILRVLWEGMEPRPSMVQGLDDLD